MIGQNYWATGVKIIYDGSAQWTARLEFFDSGFCQDASTEGVLHLRYFVSDIAAGVKTLLADARRLGIVNAVDFPRLHIYVEADGASSANLPADWRAVVAAVAAANDLESIYAKEQ